MPEILQPALTIFIDCETLRFYIALAQSRTCLWVSADPRMVRAIGKVTGANHSSRSVANHKIEDTLKQRRCGPFWFSSGCPKTGVTKEAHLHCRQCGRVSHPSQGRQSEPRPGKAKVHRRETALRGSGVSTGWFHGFPSRLCPPRVREADSPRPAALLRAERRLWRDPDGHPAHP